MAHGFRAIATGRKFGNLTVQGFDELRPWGNYHAAFWHCRCECGCVLSIAGTLLLRRKKDSCGCLKTEKLRNHFKHGDGRKGLRTAEYVAWKSMKARCYNPRQESFPRYGGRGISVCPAWRESFAVFLRDMGRKPGPNYSLERVRNNGNYEPGNCKWATLLEQANNRRSSRLTMIDNMVVNASRAAILLGVSPQTVTRRIAAGILPRVAQ